MAMYQFFSKFGYKKRQCEWLPILIVRICLGMFFILSGFFKLFDSKQHTIVLETLEKAHVPFPAFSAYLLPFLELICGILVLIGFLASLASLILFAIMIIALITDRLASIAAHGGLMILENFLYLPEVPYALMFLWLFFSGPGKVSLDYSYGKKKRRSTY
ncbi:MAG: DoxX family protein [Chlamydiia bacterium]|nr:DoxX family protein [Chlamydiia bacterium]